MVVFSTLTPPESYLRMFPHQELNPPLSPLRPTVPALLVPKVKLLESKDKPSSQTSIVKGEDNDL